MAPKALPPLQDDDNSPLNRLIAPFLRHLYSVVGVVCLLGTGFALRVVWPGNPVAGGMMALCYGGMSLFCVIGWRSSARRALLMLGPLAMLGLLASLGVGLSSGWGLLTQGLAFSSLAVLVAHLTGSAALGWATTAVALGVVGILGLAEAQGWFGLVVAPGTPTLSTRVVVQSSTILAGLVAGRGMARLLHKYIVAVKSRERRFLALLGMAARAYWETDAGGRLSQLSRRDSQGRFLPLPQAAGQLIWDAGLLQFDTTALAPLRDSLARQQALADLPVRWLDADGSLRHGLLSSEPRRDAQGDLAGFWGVVRDISGEQQARLALASTEARYQDLFNRVPTALMILSQGQVVEANVAAAKLLGYPSTTQMIGQPILQLHVPAEQQAPTQHRLATAEALGPGDDLMARELTLLGTAGNAVPVRAMAAPARHEGRPAVLSILIDETHTQAAAQALARSESLLSQVVTLAPDIITLTDLATGRYVMVNDSFCRLVGCGREEAVGHTSAELGVWRDPADRDRLVAAINQHGMAQNHLITFNTRQGSALPLLISGVRFDSDGLSYLLLNGRDLTEANRVQQEREAILTHASVGIAFTRDRRFVLANARFEAMYGWDRGQMVGQPLQALWQDPSHFQALERAVGPALARGEPVDVERDGRRRDGSPFRVRLRAQAIDPQHPTTGGTIWVVEDVTRAHEAELALARARDAAEAANRAKSAFLANTSHEIRTPLHGVLGLAMLARQPGLAADRRQLYLDQIAESAESLNSIISDILDVAKIEAGKLQVDTAPFDLPDLLASLARVYSALAAGQGLAFDLQTDPALTPCVLGDALRLRQILANLLQNALKFCATGSVRLVVRALPGHWVRFEVHDTGPGIPPEVQSQLFEPFTQADQSTTRRFGGTGLGLSICRELAGLMGGEVGLHSQAGVGSCFHALLPLPGVVATAPVAIEVDPGAGLQGARVLLVEDNPVNQMIGVALLELWGVQATCASDGPAALRAIDAAADAGQPLDAVLMDLQMPGMSGHETTQRLRQRYPPDTLPVIALTAAALVSERERALAHGMTDFLTKPIDPQRLLAALLRALPARAGARPR